MTENWDRYHPWGRCKVYAAFPWFRDGLWRLSKRCGNRVTDQPSLGHHNIWRVPQLRATLTRGEGIYRTPLLQRCEKLRIIPKRRTATELLHNFTRSKGSTQFTSLHQGYSYLSNQGWDLGVKHVYFFTLHLGGSHSSCIISLDDMIYMGLRHVRLWGPKIPRQGLPLPSV